MPEEHESTPPSHNCAPTDFCAREEYNIPLTPPAFSEPCSAKNESLTSTKLREGQSGCQKETIGYYIVWSLVFFGIWMLLTSGIVFVAFPLTVLCVVIGSAVDSSDRKKRNRGV